MPAIYTYSKALLDDSINNVTVVGGSAAQTGVINNTGASNAPFTHLDIFGSVYDTSTTTSAFATINLFVYDNASLTENAYTALHLDTLEISTANDVNNQMRIGIKDVKAFPYYLVVTVQNIGTVNIGVTLRVYGRNFIFMNV